MAITTTISQLTEDQIAELELELVDMLQTAYPSLDLERGQVLRDLVLRVAAVCHALINSNIEKARQSTSLAAIEADPTLADEDTVDLLLSNYLMTRQAATNTTGLLTIVLDSLVTTVIVANTVFTDGNGNEFVLTNAYTAVTAASLVVSETDRLLRLRADGRYTFTIPVVAGTAGYIKVVRNTRFTHSPAIARVYDVYAESDFTPGQDAQSNADLVAELKNGITPQVMGGRQQIDALIKGRFPATPDISQIGYGDPEMVRDRQNVFGLSHGGKADLYVRSAKLPTELVLIKEATLIDAANRRWQVNVGKNEAPGFYDVVSILPETAPSDTQGSLTLISDTRGYDPTQSADEFVPFMSSAIDAAYTAYQTAIIVFEDANTPTDDLTVGQSKANYSLAFRMMPQLKDIQEYVTDRRRNHPGGDYLVRAPIPCFMSAEIVLELRAGEEPVIDEQAIKQAVSDLVSSITFDDGRVPVSLVADAIQELLPNQVNIRLPIHLKAMIRQPDGQISYASSTSVLEAPDLPGLSMTSRTVAFFLPVDSISIETQAISIADSW